jgi:hypothetical protein
MKTNQRIRSFRSQITRRCFPMFVRNDSGQLIRLLSFTNYQPCAHGGEPQAFIKLLTHERHPPGCQVPKAESRFYIDQIIPALQPGVWTELIIK